MTNNETPADVTRVAEAAYRHMMHDYDTVEEATAEFASLDDDTLADLIADHRDNFGVLEDDDPILLDVPFTDVYINATLDLIRSRHTH